MVRARPFHAARLTAVLAAACVITSATASAGPSGAEGGDRSARVPLAGAGRRGGIDVSHWQSYIRWGRVARSGVDFAIAKATEGKTFVDHMYDRNKRRAEDVGLRFTAYHFAQPSRVHRSVRLDARMEADHFLRYADLRGRNLVPALDLERTGGLKHRDLRRWTLAWLQRVETRLGVKAMVYTSPAFWSRYLGNTRAVARRGYEVLWVAHWGTNHPSVPARRWDGNGWTFWQWTNCARVPGIRSCVDRNYLGGQSLWSLTLHEQRSHRR